MLLIEHKIWHGISPEGYRQEFTRIDKHHLCQLNNVILNILSGLDLVRRSRSHVKGYRRGGVCVLRMLLFLFCFFYFIFYLFFFFAKWLLTALARTLLKFGTLGQRSRSTWPKMYLWIMKRKIAKISNVDIS